MQPHHERDGTEAVTMQREKCKTKYSRQIWTPTCFSLRTFLLFVLLLLAISESCRIVVEAYVGVSFFVSPFRTCLTPGFSGSSIVSITSQSSRSYFLDQNFSRSSSGLFSNRLYAIQMEEDKDNEDDQESVLHELDMGGSGKGRGNGGYKYGGGSGNRDNDNDGNREEDCDFFLGAISLLLTSRAKLFKTGKSIIDVSGNTWSNASPVLLSSSTAMSFKCKKRNITLTALSAVLLLFERYLSVVMTSSKDFASWYLKKLETDPVVTKSISAGLIGFVGDYAAQWFEYVLSQKQKKNLSTNSKISKGREGRKNNNNCQVQSHSSFRKDSWLSINGNYDRRRGFALLVDGIFISGPIMHWGYDLFERLMPVQRSAGSGGGSVAAIAHVLGDCVLLDSIFVGTAFVMTGILEGHSFRHDVVPQLCNEYRTIMKTSWAASLALLPLQFASFRFLPVTLRTVAVSVMDVVWDGVVSFMMHRSRR